MKIAGFVLHTFIVRYIISITHWYMFDKSNYIS